MFKDLENNVFLTRRKYENSESYRSRYALTLFDLET